MPKVIVLATLGENLVHEKFLNSVFNLTYRPITYMFGRTGEIPKTHKRWCYDRWRLIARSRNHILRSALLIDWDYVLWLDADMELYPDLIQDLLKFTPQEKVVSGLYKYREPSGVNVGGPVDPKNEHCLKWVGFGCLLMAREVVEKVGLLNEETCKGSDLDYCERMRKAKYRIYSSGIVLNHYPIGKLR